MFERLWRGDNDHAVGRLVVLRGVVLARGATKDFALGIYLHGVPEMPKQQRLFDKHPVADVSTTKSLVYVLEDPLAFFWCNTLQLRVEVGPLVQEILSEDVPSCFTLNLS
mgnify:CR=1 FL=1